MTMRNILFVAFAASALTSVTLPASAQGIRIGPGGVDIDDGRGFRDERRMRRVCRELRDRCENKDLYGEEGQGNCRRYHRTCD